MLSQDVLTRIVNVHWGGGVYVIIAATNNDYADSNLESVVVLDQRSLFVGEGEGVEPISGTLIECPPNAGDRFVTLNPTSHNPIGLEDIRVYVCPRVEEVRSNWFDYVLSVHVDGFADADGLPLGPYLWIARTLSGSPNTMHFKIRFESHLIAPAPGETDRIVQAYPTSGENIWPFGPGATTYFISGWQVVAYRIDSGGTGPIYSGTDPSWNSDIILVAGLTEGYGLKFGKDPPKIESD